MTMRAICNALLGAAVVWAALPLAGGAAPLPVIRGSEFNPLAIDRERLDWKKVEIRDTLADMKSTFLKIERKRGFRQASYYKFILRDSGLSCFLNRYDRREVDRFVELSKGDRLTVVGRIERAGKGIRRLVNPKYVVRVEEIRPGWTLGDWESVWSRNGETEYREVDPEVLEGPPAEYVGDCVRFRDRFSVASSSYTNIEKDLDLSPVTSLKFRGERCPWPCYLKRDRDGVDPVGVFRSGEKITVSGRLIVRAIPENRLVLLAVDRVERGWD